MNPRLVSVTFLRRHHEPAYRSSETVVEIVLAERNSCITISFSSVGTLDLSEVDDRRSKNEKRSVFMSR